jgi:hypothetical protein
MVFGIDIVIQFKVYTSIIKGITYLLALNHITIDAMVYGLLVYVFFLNYTDI